MCISIPHEKMWTWSLFCFDMSCSTFCTSQTCLLTLPRMCHVFLFLGFWLKPFLCIDSFLTCSQQLSFKFYSNFTSLWLLPPLFHSSVIFPSLNSKYLSVIWKSFMLYAVIACLLHSFNILFCVCSSSFLDMFCMYFQPKGRKHPFY